MIVLMRSPFAMNKTAVPSLDKLLGGPAIVTSVATLKFIFHMLAAANYGLFVDELYFLACGEHLAWGYPDMPPLTAVQAFLTRMFFGDSLYAIHIFPSLAAAVLVVVVGALTRRLGGGPWAQGIAALGAAIAPGWLAVLAYLSMNSIELVLVALLSLIVMCLIRGGNLRLWLVFGVVGGIGLLNKHTMLLFCFALIIALLAARERRVLFSWWLVAGGLLAFLIFLPNLIWMWQHGFPHLEILANVRRNRRDVELSAVGFLGQQALFMMPLLPLLLAGLWHFLVGKEGRPARSLGYAFLAALGILLALESRTYYLLPAYSTLIAGGAVAFESWTKRPSLAWLRCAFPVMVLFIGGMIAPLMMPLLPPETYIQYERRLGISQPRIENRGTIALPQLFADRFGWPQMAEAVAKAYHDIPQPEREQTVIFAQDYGQAGAIDFYGPRLGLPKAISGHLAYWYWGPRGYSGQAVLVMGDNRRSLERWFEQVEEVGSVGHPYAMASQHWKLHLCRKPKGWKSFAEVWPRLKSWG